MTDSADQTILALRNGYDDLAGYVRQLDEAALAGPSGARDWDVAHVLSHLGSGAEIGLATLEGALSSVGPPSRELIHGVWDRWNGMPAGQQREEFLAANQRLVQRYEGLDQATRANLRIDMGFLPAPVSVARAAGMRLAEFTYHAWDAKVGADTATALAPEAVPLMLHGMADTVGFVGRVQVLNGRRASLAVRLTDPDRSFGLDLGDKAACTDWPKQPDGTLSAPAEAWLRLVAGRLAPSWTPPTVQVTGPIGLDDLRRVFPGY